MVDVTGGGNSFCGGFMMAYHLSDGDWLASGVAGIISSGCIIENWVCQQFLTIANLIINH